MYRFTWISERGPGLNFWSFNSRQLQVAIMMSASLFIISCSFLVLYINRSTGTGTSTPSEPKSWRILFWKHTLSPMFTNQIIGTSAGKQYISNTPTEGGDYSPWYTTAKKINNYLVTQRQIGDSQPFSPLELIAIYPGKNAVQTKCQQTGDKAEKKRNTLGIGAPFGEDNSIRVKDLIFFYW